MRRGTLVAAAAAVALVATALVALPAAAQDQEVTATAAATGTSPPAKPLGLHASASHDAVTLTWTASVDPTVTHYAILRRDPNTDALGVFAVIEPNAGAGTSYTDSSVSASGSYVYRVKSVSPTGVSKWSGYRRADTPAAPPPPTTTTQPPVPEPVTLKLVKIEPPPPPDPDPDPDIFLPSTQGEPPLIPRAQLVIQTDQDANPVVPLDWALKPSGLTGGDQFRLLFRTHTGRAPTSTDIDDYNTYVQDQANAGSAHTAIKPYASGFRVVGSTADVDARDNTSTRYTSNDKGVPIYWLNGNKVADDYQDFYDGTWDDEAHPTRRNGAVRFPGGGFVFTGSGNDGRAKSGTPFGANSVEVGRLAGTGGPLSAGGTLSRTDSNVPYYALSEVFTVVPFTDAAGQRFEDRYAPTGVPAGDPARLGLDPGAPPAYATVEEILARSADDFVPRGVTATAHEDGIRVRWQSSGQLSACTPIPGRSIYPEGDEEPAADYHRAGYDIERVPGTQVVEKFTHPSGYNAWRVTETGASWKYRCVNRAFLVGYEVYRTSFGNVGRPSDSQPYRVAYVPINAPGGLVFDDRSSDALVVPRVHNYQVRALYVHERDITGSGAVRDFRSRLSRGTWISRR